MKSESGHVVLLPGRKHTASPCLLEEGKANTNFKYKYRIFASDIDKIHWKKRELAVYPESALGNISLKRIKVGLTCMAILISMKPEIKQSVEFSFFNILGSSKFCPPASIFGNFDLVFCSNVLIYYKPESRKQILDKLDYCSSLAGYLVTGETQRAIALEHGFKEAYPQTAIFQMKSRSKEI